MAYRDIPLQTDRKNQSQADIRENFDEISTLVAVDHETFGTAANVIGKHKKVIFREQAGDQTTLVNEMALYTKDAGAEPNLYLRKENDTTVYNLTPSTTGHAAAGYEILPSGLKIIWGTGQASGAGAVINFADGGFGTAVYNVTITKIGGGGTQDFVHVVTGTVLNASFQAASHTRNGNNSTVTVYYQAIGK